jgi:hypothetical protein
VVKQIVPGDPSDTPYDAGVALVAPPSFLASCAGVDAGDLVTLEVEVQPIVADAGGFQNSANVDAGSVPSDGNPALATLSWLDAGSYAWQVRGITLGGSISDWVAFNDGGLGFVICGSGSCPDTTGYVCMATDTTTDPTNCWACGNSCNNGWCDPNFPDGGEPGSGGVFGCHTPTLIKGGLTAPEIAATDPVSHCYYYAEANGLNSQSNSVPLAAQDWYKLNPPLQLPTGIAADPNGVALATNVAPNDAGMVNEVLYFPNDGGCGSGVNAVLDARTTATYHGIASDGTYVYLTVTTVVGNPDAGMTDDQVWKIPIATGSMLPPLIQGLKNLADIIYNPIANKLFFISRGGSASPNQIYSMNTDGSMASTPVTSAPEAFGPTPALAYSPGNGGPGTLYYTSATGAYSASAGGGNSQKILLGLTGPTGITTYREGVNRTDTVTVTTGDGKLIEWHQPSGNSNTLATSQSHPSYPLPYAASCAGGGSCTFQMTWLSEVVTAHGGWFSIDFPN